MRVEKCCLMCGKDSSEIKRFIIGKHGAICPDCVYRCMAILQTPNEPTSPVEQPAA